MSGGYGRTFRLLERALVRIQVRDGGIAVTDDVREHVERHLHFALSRFGGQVRNATVRLSETRAPNGFGGKTCNVEVGLLGQTEFVVVEDCDPELYVAIDRALERTGRAVGRALERRRDQTDRPGDKLP